MTDGSQYYLAMQSARKKFGKDSDNIAYLADCLYIALHMGASELAGKNPKLRYLPAAVSGAQWALKGLTDQIAHLISDPAHNKYQTHTEFLSGLPSHMVKYVDRDLAPVKEVLLHLGIWREESSSTRRTT